MNSRHSILLIIMGVIFGGGLVGLGISILEYVNGDSTENALQAIGVFAFFTHLVGWFFFMHLFDDGGFSTDDPTPVLTFFWEVFVPFCLIFQFCLLVKNIKKKSPSRGFTLPEILVVIAIMAIITSLFIPPLLERRMEENEQRVELYLFENKVKLSDYRFIPSTAAIEEAKRAVYGEAGAKIVIDLDYVEGYRQHLGYLFHLIQDEDQWAVWAWPASPGSTGNRCFFKKGEEVRSIAYDNLPEDSDPFTMGLPEIEHALARQQKKG